MKHNAEDGMKLVGAKAGQMQVFSITNNVGIMKSANVNVEN